MLRKAPERLPLIRHRPIDCSCVGIEAEDLGPSHFMDDLRDDMGRLSTGELARRYPELLFTFHRGSKRPRGYDLTETCRGGHMAARWRTAPLS